MYIYFVQKGVLNFIIPKYADATFYQVQQGDIIGLEDYIYNLTSEGENFNDEDKEVPLTLFEADDYGRRRFNVVAEGSCNLMKFNIFDFQRMLVEFQEFAQKLIQLQIQQSQKLI
jgi:CRP-like cAMP-binding protein